MKARLRICLVFLFFSLFGEGLLAQDSLPKSTSGSSIIVVKSILITGNQTTKENIVRRELLFVEGDTLTTAELEMLIKRSKENLFNTSLFNYITINLIDIDSVNKQVFILLEERWYLWPYLIFEQADRNLSSFFHNGDWSRINYGLMLIKFNFRGRRETLKFKARLGYKEQLQIYYDIPYLTRDQKHGISMQYSWFRQKETNYATLNDKPQYIKLDGKTAKKYHDAFFQYTYRPRFDARHNFMLEYTNIRVADTVVRLNPYFLNSDNPKAQYFTLLYQFDFDKRDYKYYPLKGYNILLEANKTGLSILPSEMEGYWWIKLAAYKYWKHSERWYTGFGGKGKFAPNKRLPYFEDEALGYADNLRSFEYYVIDGQKYITGRSFVKYAIVPMKVTQIESWGWQKFNKIHYSLFVNAFVDAGYVHQTAPDLSNKLPNQGLVSAGLGIDLITYYDQVFRFEYTHGWQGRSGFYVHVLKAF